MPILCQWVHKLIVAGDTHEYLNNDLGEVGGLTLHDALLAVVGLRFEHLAVLVKVPIFQVLVPRCHKILPVLWKRECIDRFAKFVTSDSILAFPVPHKQASVIGIAQGDQVAQIGREHYRLDAVLVTLQVLNLRVLAVQGDLPDCYLGLSECPLTCC